MSKACEQEKPNKPNLKTAARNNRATQAIIASCVLAAIYMYPSILRPLFGIGSESVGKDEVETKLKELNKVLSKRRPDFMPDWTSPFAPKK